MKKPLIIVLFLLLNACFNLLQAQTFGWTQLSYTPSYKLNDVYCVNKDTVVAVGENGCLIRSTDGGTSWDSISSQTMSTLNKVTFVNDSIGYSCGANGTILKTNNAGKNWTNIGVNTSLNFLSMCFINKDTGWVAGGVGDFIYYGPIGSKGILAKTIDGGNSWSIDSSYTKTIASVFFIDKDTGFICLNNFPISLMEKTTDAGNSFSINKYDSLTTNYIYNIHFINSKTGYFTSNATPDYNKDGIYKTEDYGQTWIKIIDQWGIASSYVLDSCILYVFYTEMPGTGAFGRDSCLQTTIQSPIFNGMHLIDKDYGFCVKNKIYKRGIVQSIDNFESLKMEITPNPFHQYTTLKLDGNSQISGFKVINSLGQVVLQKSTIPNTTEEVVDLSRFPNGIYFLMMDGDNGMNRSVKLIKY